MLQTPSFVDPLRHIFLLPAVQVRRVEHGDLDSIAKLRYQGCQQSGTRWVGIFSRAPECVCQDGQFQLGVVLQRLLESRDEFMFGLANVQCRQKDSSSRTSYLSLYGILSRLSACSSLKDVLQYLQGLVEGRR